ncbi:HEAT repeat domain-containing protein [Rubellicoccus peritrichatus]|uniref:HEAT repeat domain-containing protein n=1 Tax=Rubellicoccus peritrichatus TaxID=3080537 RepID=A0AAQ3QSF0_9BACT|nr:HEAT repeat domain-containing protein [Puniceicoccus sp. CR14]WOO42353.1 HEAT repeat domain-containing protein [Puniceicoccus sp. CR14]
MDYLKHTIALGTLLLVLSPLAAQNNPNRVRIQNSGIPRHLLPPEVIPQIPLTEEERITIDRGISDLRSPDKEVRTGAVMILGKYDHPSARLPVIEALSDESPRVRRAALVSVAEWSRGAPHQAIIPVLKLVGDEDLEIRRTASATIPTMMTIRQTYQIVRPSPDGPKPLPSDIIATLKAGFKDEDPVVRRNLVNHYYSLNINLPGETWIELLNDPDRQVRLAALPLAARHAPREVFFAKAKELAKSEDRIERLQLARELNLRGVHPEAQEILKLLQEDEDQEVASEAILGQLKFASTNSLFKTAVKRLLEGKMTQDQGIRFFRVIQINPNDAIPYLPSLIQLDDSVLRREAVAAYLDSGIADGKPRKLDPLVEDPSESVRKEVINYLASGTGRTDDTLIETMVFSPYLDVRAGLITVSNQFQAEPAAELLMDLLLDENVQIRARALQETVNRKLSPWSEVLSASLLDPDYQMQRAALGLILKNPFPGDTEALTNFLTEHPDSPLAPLIRARLGKPKGSDT